jgi:hypothetical protein
LSALLKNIGDWDTFVAFLIIDGCTAGKSREPLKWMFAQIKGKARTRFDDRDIIAAV